MALTGLPVDFQPATTPDDEAWRKRTLYATLQRVLFEECGVRITHKAAQLAFEAMTQLVFQRVVQAGFLRLPRGFGSLRLAKSRFVKERRLPTGVMVPPCPDRVRVRYTAGVAVHEMLGTNVQKYQRKTPRPAFAVPTTGDSPV